jgi:UDP-N-acetylmuramoyl-L-alanyl-D-glutamate--2,6-diaminopimelate ligase
MRAGVRSTHRLTGHTSTVVRRPTVTLRASPAASSVPPRSVRSLVSARLSTVCAALPGATLRGIGGADPVVVDVTHDTRSITEGSLYCAVVGRSEDGHGRAREAVQRGAIALLVERWLDLDVAQVRVEAVRAAMGPAAAVVHGRPSEDLLLVGVTGTNGKTTVTSHLEAAFGAAGLGTGVIGTLGARIHGATLPHARTTPEGTDLQRLLRTMHTRGVDAVAMEVSSHGLDLHRVDGTRFDVAVFTNLTQDHLDWHGTMQAYLTAKARLFTPELAEQGVVMLDAPGSRDLVALARIPVTTVGSDPAADVRVHSRHVGPDGSRAVVELDAGPLEVSTPTLGAFNLDNALAAVVAAVLAGVAPETAARGVARSPAPAGRLEPVVGEAPGGPTVLVDYAHTPDAIAAVVAVGRDLVRPGGRLTVVVGAGGDRDREKRTLMGSAAAGADRVVVTDDNPRGEAPAAIRAAILAGVRASSRHPELIEQEGRAEAIALAIEGAADGDVVLLLGKGHETTQEVAGVRTHFDDREVARASLLAVPRIPPAGPAGTGGER